MKHPPHLTNGPLRRPQDFGLGQALRLSLGAHALVLVVVGAVDPRPSLGRRGASAPRRLALPTQPVEAHWLPEQAFHDPAEPLPLDPVEDGELDVEPAREPTPGTPLGAPAAGPQAATEWPQPGDLARAVLDDLDWSVVRTERREPRQAPPREPEPPADPAHDAGVDRAASELHCPPPPYPRLSIRTGEEGVVLCRLHVDAEGHVTRVEVVESSGHGRLDEAARTTLATWIFRPRLVAGQGQGTTLLHPVTFRLDPPS